MQERELASFFLFDDGTPEALEETIASLKTAIKYAAKHATWHIVSDSTRSIKHSFTIIKPSFLLEAIRSLPANSYIAFVPAGTTYQRKELRLMLRELKGHQGKQLIVAYPEGGYQYRLNSTVEPGSVISLNDETALWIGATPSFYTAAVASRVLESGVFPFKSTSHFFLKALSSAGSAFISEHEFSTGLLHEDRPDENEDSFDLDWYIGWAQRSVELFASFLEQTGELPPMIQNAYLHLLQQRIRVNTNTRNKRVLRGEDLERFLSFVGEALRFIDDRYLVQSRPGIFSPTKGVRLWLFRLKRGDQYQPSIRSDGSSFSLVDAEVRLSSIKSADAVIDSLFAHNGNVDIAGYFPSHIPDELVGISMHVGKSDYTLSDDGRYADYLVFGKLIYRNFSFNLSIPEDELLRAKSVSFSAFNRKTGERYPLNIRFRKSMAKISNYWNSYWAHNGFIMKYRERKIIVARNSRLKHLESELRYQFTLIRGKKRARRAALLRAAYFLTKPWLGKKEIWLYQDKIYKAGDNGEYAFRQALQHRDGRRKLYVVRPDVHDGKRLKREKFPILPFGTLRQKLTFLHCNLFFATHTVQPTQAGFRANEIFFRDLYQYQVIFIQHGLTVQSLPWILNKYVDNVSKYCVASRFEEDNLLQADYGFDRNEIAHTGLARYDGLFPTKIPKRQILLTPTWRSYLAAPAVHGSSRPKNAKFTSSTYYQVYQDLINSNRLNEILEKHNFELLFLLHPVTSSQVDDFSTTSSRINIIAAADDVSYETLLSESALMITDYSGVQFDFAFQKKPVLYFHPPELPATYDEAVYRYSKHALGPILLDFGSLLDEIDASLARDCTVESRYLERVEDFFYNFDDRASERIYQVADELVNGQKHGA